MRIAFAVLASTVTMALALPALAQGPASPSAARAPRAAMRPSRYREG